MFVGVSEILSLLNFEHFEHVIIPLKSELIATGA